MPRHPTVPAFRASSSPRLFVAGAFAAAAAAAVVVAGAAVSARAAPRQPVFVGARVCASCHDGAAAGHQFSGWMQTGHARAYASLALPSARRIADLSGIPGDPFEAPICLGCHATASDAEPWELDPGFRLRDGVQCERCHGPGSEYADAAVMRDRAAAKAAGLVLPPRTECVKCHYVKGSHFAVHGRGAPDADAAWARIEHRVPAKGGASVAPAPVSGAASTTDPAGLAGADSCAGCHDTAARNRQVQAWRLTKHSRAWAVLTTPRGAEVAQRAGVEGDPASAPACLRCHATAGTQRTPEGPDSRDGVTCESCHGAGAAHVRKPEEARTPTAKPGADVCAKCHADAHGKPFDASVAMAGIAHPARAPRTASAPRYRSPRNLTVRPGGREVWVACESADVVLVVDTDTRKVLAEVAVGGQPDDVAFAPDGSRAYVSCRLADAVTVIDATARRAVAAIPVGDEPHGLLTDATGTRLFVANTATDDVSVVDTAALRETHRLPAGRNPWSLALSPDGRRLLVTSTLSRLVPFRTPAVSEVTEIDATRGRIEDRRAVPETNLLQGIAWHPSGEFALFTLNRTKNLVPMTRIQQGWTITNGLGIAWQGGRTDQVLLDEPNAYFADAADVAFTPDGSRALVTSQGTDRVAVVDVASLLALVRNATPHEREHVLPNHLGASSSWVVAYVPTGAAPRGIAVTPDGAQAFVANRIDDSLTRIDLATLATERVDLGGPRTETRARLGERLFHSARNTYQRQFSCASCHPDGHVDGLSYDIEADGIGVNPVDNRTLRGICDTDPFKWSGTNPSLARQCGARLAAFFTRIQPFTPDELAAVNEYTVTIPRPPNRHRRTGAPLTGAQARGKRVFERTRTADGREIPVGNRCITCHFPPLYTDRARHDVGSRNPLDRSGTFDVPHLNNIYDSAPYLHDGSAGSLEEIWTRFNPYDTHGVTNDMTKDQLNDLIEYLKTL